LAVVQAPPPAQVRELAKNHRRLWGIVLAIMAFGAILWAIGNPRADMLFTLAVAPTFFLLWHFHHADKYKSEPVSLLIITFAIGGVLALVASLVEPNLPKNAGRAGTFLYFLLGVGLIEEFAKFLAVRVWAYRSKHFNETMDGVIFGITAALGFATVENIFYVFDYGGTVAIFRAFVSVPGHAFYGAIMGFYLGQAKFQHKWWLALVGLALATLLHGIFDTMAELSGAFGFLALPALVWMIYFFIVRKEIQKAQSESLYAPPPAP